jgi:putative component of toxin-antitoxin plasmid stabilization module
MYHVELTREFAEWLVGLRDRMAQKRIAISELRVDYGPGYRIYFALRDQMVVILLCGSDKSDQSRAIRLAKDLAKSV